MNFCVSVEEEFDVCCCRSFVVSRYVVFRVSKNVINFVKFV